jgi:hypothetical protein
MKKNIIIAIVIIAAVAVGYGIFKYNEGPRTAAQEDAFAKVTAPALYAEFLASPDSTSAKYHEKILEISGTIEKIETDAKGAQVINLVTNGEDGGIMSATLEAGKTTTAKEGESIKIKGIVAGYMADDLLGGEVQLTQCSLVQ